MMASKLTLNADKNIRITPLVESLAGSAAGASNNFKKEYTDYLEKKYHCRYRTDQITCV